MFTTLLLYCEILRDEGFILFIFPSSNAVAGIIKFDEWIEEIYSFWM